MRNSWTGISGKLGYSNAQEIANDLITNYINETIDEVTLIFNEFKSLILQKVAIKKLLPIGAIPREGEAKETVEGVTDFLYEPSREVIFEQLLPKYVEVQIYRALLEAQTSEEAARMTAMENATNNCRDLITKVTLQANKVRQASITKELMDIVGGVEALK